MLDPLKLISQYYDPKSLGYRVLVQHSQEVARKALSIARGKPELDIDKTFVYEASMLHDIGIFLTHAPRIGCLGTEKYIRHGYLGAELLRQLGYPKHAFVCERHTGLGLTMEEIKKQQIDLPNGVYLPISIEEKLICYADKFFSKTRLGQEQDLEKVFNSMAKYGAGSLQRFEALHNLFRE